MYTPVSPRQPSSNSPPPRPPLLLIAGLALVAWMLHWPGGDGTPSVSPPPPPPSAVPRLPGAVVVYTSPEKDSGCSIIGAVEPGRAYTVRAIKGAWTQVDIADSGTLWIKDGVTQPKRGAQGHFDRAVIVYSDPGPAAQRCTSAVRAVAPDEPFTLLAWQGSWAHIRVGGTEAWTDELFLSR